MKRVRWWVLGLLFAWVGPSGAAVPKVAIDLRALDEESYARLDGLNLEKRVVIRLVQERFAVVAPSERPDVLLRLSVEGDRLHLLADGPGGAQARVVEASGPELGELHLEVEQKLADIARAVWRTPEQAPPPPLPPLPRAPEEETAPAGPSTPRAALELQPLVGVQGRSGGVDLVFGGLARYGGALGLTVTVAALPSSEGELRVLESRLAAGIGIRVQLGEALFLEPSLIAGVQLHSYWHRAGSGSRVDGYAALPLALDHALGPRLRLGVRVGPTWSSHERIHRDGDSLLWRRGALGLEGLVHLSWRT